MKFHPWFITSMNCKFAEYLKSSVRNWKDQYFCFQINLWSQHNLTLDGFKKIYFDYFQTFKITHLFIIKKKSKKNFRFASETVLGNIRTPWKRTLLRDNIKTLLWGNHVWIPICLPDTASLIGSLVRKEYPVKKAEKISYLALFSQLFSSIHFG